MAETKSILLLGNYRPALVLARMFRARGFKVFVGTHGCERLCQHSNAVSGTWDHSPLDRGVSVFADELKTFSRMNPDLKSIFPVAEEYVRLFAEYETAFRGLPAIITMENGLVKKCLNKTFMLDLANSVEVATACFSSTEGLIQTLNSARDEVGFPLIVRPRDSTKRIGGNKAVTIRDETALIECFEKNNLEKRALLLQQKFEGRRHNVYFAAIEGKATRLLHAVIERTDRIDGTGLAVEGLTLEPNGDLISQTSRLLNALNYSGIGCAQFLVNERTGETSFLEINPRIAGNHALPEYAGLDLGWFNYERVVTGAADAATIHAPAGLRYCWISGDLMGAKVSYLRGEIGLSGLFAWFGKAIVACFRSRIHMVYSFRDPMPAIHGLWNLFPRVARWQKPEVSPGENTIYTNNSKRLT